MNRCQVTDIQSGVVGGTGVRDPVGDRREVNAMVLKELANDC
jgi:hypothetical protein